MRPESGIVPIAAARGKGVKCRSVGRPYLTKFQQAVRIESTSIIVNCGSPRRVPAIDGYFVEMLDQHRLLLLAVLAMFALGCRKDKGSEAPTVRILEPGAGFSVNLPDTVTVRVQVSDDVAVERLVVMIADQAGIPIAPIRAIDLGSSSATIDVEIPVLNEAISSNGYQIIARASDAEQDAQAFLPITVNAAPLRRRAIFLVPRSAPPFTIHRIDSAGILSAFTSLAELNGASISPEWLYTAGGASDDLKAWDPVSGASVVRMSNANVSGSAPYFWNPVVDPNDGRLYVGTWEGLLRGFGPSGNQAFSAVLTDGYQSRMHIKVDDVLLSLALAPSQNQWRMISFTYSAGVQISTFPLSFEPIDAYYLDSDRALLFGNDANGGLIAQANVDQGGVIVLREFAADSLLAAVAMPSGAYAVASTTGIHRYQSSTNSLLALSNERSDAIAFDAASGALLASFGQELRTMDPSTGATISTTGLPQPVAQFLIQLNR